MCCACWCKFRCAIDVSPLAEEAKPIWDAMENRSLKIIFTKPKSSSTACLFLVWKSWWFDSFFDRFKHIEKVHLRVGYKTKSDGLHQTSNPNGWSSPLRSHKRLTKEVELHEAMNKQLTIPCKRFITIGNLQSYISCVGSKTRECEWSCSNSINATWFGYPF